MDLCKRQTTALTRGRPDASTAVHLLRGGTAITLITEGQLASGATGASLSWLNPPGDLFDNPKSAGLQRFLSEVL